MTAAAVPALEAARALATEGHHVHYIAEGESQCLSGYCPVEVGR